METQNMEILGAQLKGDLFCHYSFRQTIGKDVHDSGKIKSERVIHEDLRAAFAAITIHMPLILEDLKPGDVADINSDVSGQETNDKARDMIARFRLTEFVIDLEQGSVQLIGTKSLDLGTLPVQTPFVKWDGDYLYALDLRVAVDKAISEVLLYIDGKCAPQLEQGDLFGDAPDEQPGGEIEVPEKPKRGRGRPKKDKSALEGVTVTATGPDGSSVTMTGEEFEQRVGEYTPATDDEFNQPVTAFQRDPLQVDDEL